MQNTDKRECFLTSELQYEEVKLDKLKFLSICNKTEKADAVNKSAEKKDLLKNSMLIKGSGHSNKEQPSKVTSVLDPYCKTNIFDESSDFIECDFKQKFKQECKKNEISCEICKDVITHLDVHNREIHVNNCIDRQISHGFEIQSKASEAKNIFILDCPLCFKQFLSLELRASHIKKCGKSKGLSIQSILKALELQERHALERISLGLPAKPIKVAKSHKNPVKKAISEPKSKVNSDIQLAKALSLSLTTSVQHEEGKVPISLKPPAVHDRPGKKTKTVLSSIPLLVLRTEEERKRILLDKVAKVLTLVNKSENGPPSSFATDSLNKEIEDLDLVSLLWFLSSKASEASDYYVEDLINWIKPSDVVTGAKLFHLSQIPGHEIVTQLPCEYTFSIPESGDKTSINSGSPLASVIECLRSLVASSWMSDVDIHTACGTVVPAHRLLLAARCPALKRDSSFCLKNGKVVLKWETVSFEAVLQFLNFIYTGDIDMKENLMSEFFYLANKYEVLDLQTLLHSAKDSSLSSEMESDNGMSSNTDKITTSCYKSEIEMTDESEEEPNVALDIVYNCITSSLKPSQDPGSIQKCNVLNEVNKSPQKATPKKEGCSTSPVIFKANSSENDSTDEENVELFPSSSQKSILGLSKKDVEVLQLSSTESNNSQDSVKFLMSSFSSNHILQKSVDYEENDILRSPISLTNCFSSLNKSSPRMTSVPLTSPISHELDEFYYLEADSKLEHSSEILHFPSKTKTQILANIKPTNEHINPSNETKLGATQINTPLKSEGIMRNDRDFDTSFKDGDIPTKNSLCFEKRVPSTPESLKLSECTPPTMSVFSRLGSNWQKTFPNKIQPPPPSDSNVDLQLHNPSTESANQSSVLCSQKKNSIGESDNKYLETPNRIYPIDSFKSSDSVYSKLTCSDEKKSSAVDETLTHFDRETKLRETVSSTHSKEIVINLKDSSQTSVLFPEPFAYFATDDHLEVAPIHFPKNAEQKTTGKATTLCGDSAIIQPHFQLSDSPITPLPDYKNMMTPEIKQALRKIGVKALPRKKALMLLSHVYEETHPLVQSEANKINSMQSFVPKDPKEKTSKKRKILKENTGKPSKKKHKDFPLQDASQESDDSITENPDWARCVPEISFSQFQEDSPTKASRDDIESIKQYIQSNETLYVQTLFYKPLNLMEFHQELKDNGVKVSIQKLTDFLDEQCITFTCPRKEEYKKKQTARTQRFRKNMIAKLSQQCI